MSCSSPPPSSGAPSPPPREEAAAAAAPFTAAPRIFYAATSRGSHRLDAPLPAGGHTLEATLQSLQAGKEKAPAFRGRDAGRNREATRLPNMAPSQGTPHFTPSAALMERLLDTPPRPTRVNKGEAGRAKGRERTGAAAPSPWPPHMKASQRRPPARSNAVITPALRMRGERGTAPRLHLPPPSSGQRGSLPKPRYFLPLPTRGGAGGCPGRWGRPHLCEG